MQLTALMGELQEGMPAGQFDEVVSIISASAAVSPNDEPVVARQRAEEFGECLIDYFRSVLAQLSWHKD